MKQEIISLENLRREDQNFCVEALESEKPEISSWNGGMIRKRVLKNEKIEKKLSVVKEESAKIPVLYPKREIEKSRFCEKIKIGACGNDKNRSIGFLRPCKGFQQQDVVQLRPEIYAPECSPVSNNIQYRSWSLGYQIKDADFSNFGCSIPETLKVSKKSKAKMNVYTNSYYNKFFTDEDMQRPLVDYERSLKRSKFFSKNDKRSLKLPNIKSGTHFCIKSIMPRTTNNYSKANFL